jgi:4-hydroxy-2-oxoheptanedioate aldolase
MVMDAAEARAIVAATKYAPRGNRSVGGGFHAINYGATAEEYYHHANDEILVVIQTEHIRAVDVADEIYAVPGIDAIFIGPNDLAYSLRSRDGAMPSQEVFEGTLTRILQAAQRHRVPCGLHVLTAEDALQRARQGFQFIAVGSELKFMLDAAADAVRQINPEEAVAELAKY